MNEVRFTHQGRTHFFATFAEAQEQRRRLSRHIADLRERIGQLLAQEEAIAAATRPRPSDVVLRLERHDGFWRSVIIAYDDEGVGSIADIAESEDIADLAERLEVTCVVGPDEQPHWPAELRMSPTDVARLVYSAQSE